MSEMTLIYDGTRDKNGCFQSGWKIEQGDNCYKVSYLTNWQGSRDWYAFPPFYILDQYLARFEDTVDALQEFALAYETCDDAPFERYYGEKVE